MMTLLVANILRACDALVALKPGGGYTQHPTKRRSILDVKQRKWIAGKDGDCSFIAAAVNYIAGAPITAIQRMLLWSGNIIAVLVATGHYKRIKVSQYKSLAALRKVLRAGDTMRGPGHVVVIRSATKWLSWESNELGKPLGGKAGKQKGEHVGYRAPYMRKRGWTEVARLISPSEFMGRILAAYSKGKSYTTALTRLTVRAPFDGPLWAAFMAAWAKLDKGMRLSYSPEKLTVPEASHAYVVLGAGLNANGTPPAKLIRRLRLAKAAWESNPASWIVVTGGKPRKGITEASAAKAWLVANGVPASRILTESASSSTIGNATGALAIMRKAKIRTYTLVSDASHLRRASVLFMAAQLKVETEGNVMLGIKPTTVLAFNDYGPTAVITARPVSKATKATITSEVATLLRLTPQYQAAL